MVSVIMCRKPNRWNCRKRLEAYIEEVEEFGMTAIEESETNLKKGQRSSPQKRRTQPQ
jgi:predicted DNA-binding protein